MHSYMVAFAHFECILMIYKYLNLFFFRSLIMLCFNIDTINGKLMRLL